MKPLFFIMKKSLMNHLKKIKKKPLYLISYLAIVIFIIAFIVISFIMPSENFARGNVSLFNIIITIAILVTAYFQINQGIEKGNSFFRQADVNFVFVSPISPKKVLVFGFIKQMYTTFFIMLFVAFQIPNLKNYFPINRMGVLITYLSVFALFFMMSLLSVLIYTITSKKKKRRKIAKAILNFVYITMGVWFILTLLKEKDMMQAAIKVFQNPFLDKIPIIGWFRIIFSYLIKPIDIIFIYNVAFVIITIILLLIIMYKINTDYYEDVLDATERKEMLFTAKKQGKQVKEIKANKIKKVNQNYGSGGAKAIFYRHIMEYRKTGLFIFDKSTLAVVALGVASKYFFPYSNIKTVLYFTIYMLFIYTFQGKWMDEIKRPYIYLIPASSIKKVFYGTLAEQIKNFTDGIVLFAIAGFVFKADIAIIVLSAITYMTFGSIYIYIDVLARRIFGATHSKVFKIFMKLLILLLVIVPEIVISSLVEFVYFPGVPFINHISYVILIVYNIIAAIILILLSKKIFEVADLE